jgi:hypothetical protein
MGQAHGRRRPSLPQEDEVDDVMVSTVFVGLDFGIAVHRSDPLLWETMIFGGPHDGWCARAATRSAALDQHIEALELIGQKPKET